MLIRTHQLPGGLSVTQQVNSSVLVATACSVMWGLHRQQAGKLTKG